jgi:hypothetical protein
MRIFGLPIPFTGETQKALTLRRLVSAYPRTGPAPGSAMSRSIPTAGVTTLICLQDADRARSR